MSILQYGFMQRAFLVGILLAVITPCIGITIVLKRMSMIGDALSHSSLAGVVLGLILGVNPVAGAVVMCIVAALGIEAIRKKIPRYSEVAISIVMSAGIGLAGVLSGFVENGASLNSFLFGSIVSISEGDPKASSASAGYCSGCSFVSCKQSTSGSSCASHSGKPFVTAARSPFTLYVIIFILI